MLARVKYSSLPRKLVNYDQKSFIGLAPALPTDVRDEETGNINTLLGCTGVKYRYVGISLYFLLHVCLLNV
jgi:hypothetical protein